MAGYRGRQGAPQGTDTINATAFNSQIQNQRNAYLERVENSGSLGIGSNTTNLFTGFNAIGIMSKTDEFFLEGSVTPGDNPDFRSSQNISTFKNFNTIITEASGSVSADAPDGPGIGIGPKLSTNNIDDAMNGTLATEESFNDNGNHRQRGFGWYSRKHETTTLGSYFNNRYQFNGQSTYDGDVEEFEAIKGERVDTVINYNQTSD